MSSQRAYVGTYTSGESVGIYACAVDTDGETVLERTGSSTVQDSPSFIAMHPSGGYLYAVHEVSSGGASAFRIDERDGLQRLNRVESGAGGPCHCSVHPSGAYLFVAHYTGGAVSILPIADDGRLDGPTATVQHDGSSVDSERQTEPHPHSITPGPNGRFVYVPDLGTDEIVVYELDESDGALERVTAVETEPGTGPRHLSFHPDEPLAFVINELDSTITSFRWDEATGELTAVGRNSTLPADAAVENYTADIHVHPSGQWVYGSNRGHDSIVTFDVDTESGQLGPVDWTSTGGEWPRHFALTPSGSHLFAENQHSDSITVFRLDDKRGVPIPTGQEVDVPEPVCLQFAQRSSRKDRH